jgi:UDP-N-acetylmuramoylalanine--D-glutamate ligase
MEEAVRLAYIKTAPGRVCLHSPASSSFGLFRDYRERGELFARFVREVANESGEQPA